MADPRFLVLERRDLREAIRITAPIAVAVAIASMVLFGISSPARLPLALVVIAVLIGIWRLAVGRLRRRPHVAAFLLIVAILGGRILTLYLDGASANLAEAYFGLIVVASALFLPWDGRWHGAWLAVAAAIYLAAVLTLPVMADDESYRIAFAITTLLISFAGNVLVQTRRTRTWSVELMLRDERATLREAQTRLSAAAREDPLTGLSNRRRLDEDIASIDARLARRSFGVAAVMLDLDAFKAFNDTLGHPAGDRVLSACAAAIRGAARASDHVYRYGGEEILVLLEEDTRAAALTAAKRLVRAVREQRLPHPGSATAFMTVSAGSAASEGRLVGPWAVIGEADQAMYEAKALGGNLAVAFAPSKQTEPAPAAESLPLLVSVVGAVRSA